MVLALAESKRLSVGQQRGRLRARVTEVMNGGEARLAGESLSLELVKNSGWR